MTIPVAQESTTSNATDDTSESVEPAVDRPEVPPVDCGLLRELEDVEVELGLQMSARSGFATGLIASRPR